MKITISDQTTFEKLIAQEQQECLDEVALANDLGCAPISIDRKITSDGESLYLTILMKSGDTSVSESLEFEIGYTCDKRYLEYIITLLFCRLTDALTEELHYTVVVSSIGTSIVYPPQMTLDFNPNYLKLIK